MFWYIVGSLVIIYVGFVIFSDKYSDWVTNIALFVFGLVNFVDFYTRSVIYRIELEK